MKFYWFITCWFAVNQLYAQENRMTAYFNEAVYIENSATGEKGMGFIVSEFKDSYYVATAEHVIRDASAVKIWYDEAGKPGDGKVVHLDKNVDLALVKIGKNEFSWEPKPYLTQIQINDPVWFMIKNRSARKLLPVYGAASQTITRVNNNELTAQLSGVDKGCSGGPLLGQQGIIGLITSVGNDGLTHALPIEMVREFVKREWEERWDLPLVDRPSSKKTESLGEEQAVKIAGVRATSGRGTPQRMADGEVNTYWITDSPDNGPLSTGKSEITLLLDKPTKVSAIDVFVPKNILDKYLTLVSEANTFAIRFGGVKALFDNGQTRKLRYTPQDEQAEGTWYRCQFEEVTEFTEKVILTLTTSGNVCKGCLNRRQGYVHEVRVIGRPLQREQEISVDRVQQVPLTNAAIRISGNSYTGQRLKDGNTSSPIILNLHDSNQPAKEAAIEIELPSSFGLTHLRLYNPENSNYGSVAEILPFYDGVEGEALPLEGRKGWDDVKLNSGLQARSLRLVIRKAWNGYGKQEAIAISEIQLLGKEVVSSTASESTLRPYKLAGVESSSNYANAYRLIDGEVRSSWSNSSAGNQGTSFALYLPKPARIEAIKLYNQEREISLKQVRVQLSNGSSEILSFRGTPGWEEVRLQRPGQSDVVQLNVEQIHAPNQRKDQVVVREIQILGSDSPTPEKSGIEVKPKSLTASTALDRWSPQLANDGNMRTAWAPLSSNSYEPWLRADFGVDVNISRISFSSQRDSNPVKQLTFEFSDGSIEHHQLKGFNVLPEYVNLERSHRTRWVKIIFEKWLPGSNEPIFRINELQFWR